jgi:hypothetical protein
MCPTGSTTGDFDNYAKLVADALQDRPKKGETWAYGNDSEIVGGYAAKFWAVTAPGTELLLTEQDPCDWWLVGNQPIERCLPDYAGRNGA